MTTRFPSRPVPVAILLMMVLPSLSGCASKVAFESVPQDMLDQAAIPGMPHVRTWGDRVDEAFIDSLGDAVRQYHAYLKANPDQKLPPTADILAISGGGADGAYGAGIVCGWTERGDRPEFRIVSGVSTGALIAPLVFAGPKYDQVLRDAYTTLSEKDLVKPRGLLAMLSKDGLYDTDPLYIQIGKWVDDDMIQVIAAEHAKGRRLLIGTVNLEAQRPVIWDLGAIASTGHPEAPALIRTIMLASASIPAVFEPQYLNVEVDGRTYQEMHVDGGTYAQVFLFGGGVDLNTIIKRSGMELTPRPVRLFILRNSRFDPQYLKMEPRFSPIAGRAISTLIKSQGMGDIFRLYLRCQLEGMDFNLTSIPPQFDVHAESMFDPKYMSALFQLGYDRVAAGEAWVHKPPYLEE